LAFFLGRGVEIRRERGAASFAGIEDGSGVGAVSSLMWVAGKKPVHEPAVQHIQGSTEKSTSVETWATGGT